MRQPVQAAPMRQFESDIEMPLYGRLLIPRMADGSTLNFRSAVMSPLISCCTSETCV